MQSSTNGGTFKEFHSRIWNRPSQHTRNRAFYKLLSGLFIIFSAIGGLYRIDRALIKNVRHALRGCPFVLALDDADAPDLFRVLYVRASARADVISFYLDHAQHGDLRDERDVRPLRIQNFKRLGTRQFLDVHFSVLCDYFIGFFFYLY